MNCEKSRELFVDYLGEELSKTEIPELQKHLKLCSACRQELALLARTKSTLQAGWPDESIPQSLTFDFASPQKRFWSRFLRLRMPGVVWASLSVTGCVLALLAGLALLQAQIRLENGSFSLSFGRSATSTSLGLSKTDVSETSAETVKTLLDQSLKQFELNQNTKFQQALQETKLEWEAKRSADIARVGKELKYLESTQNVVWKETLLNNS